jgi:hypothetical protein
MKRPFSHVLSILIGAIAGVVVSSAVFAFTGFSVFGSAPEKEPPPSSANNAELTELAYNVLRHIKDGDFNALSNAVHPEFGVVFSPYATVTLSTNRRFSAEQIAMFGSDTNVYVWGVYNGSGEPIEMAPIDYFSEVVLARNYFDASIIGVNRIVRSGNALENITEVFPDVRFIDFHIPGCDKDPSEELDWSSLRIGFEEFEGSLRLTIIVNSAWTV